MRFDSNGYQYYNQVVRIEFNLDHPMLGRLKVRQAIAHAIDRKIILETAWGGRGQLTYGPIGPGLRRFDSTEPEHRVFDPRAAERLLDEAGLPRGTDGIRFRLNHDFVPVGDGFTHTAEYVARALADIGIAVAVRTTNFAVFTRRISTDRDFDFATARANNMFDPTVGVQRLYWSKNFKKGVPFSNGSHYASPDADAALEAAAVGPGAAARLFHRIPGHRRARPAGRHLASAAADHDREGRGLCPHGDRGRGVRKPRGGVRGPGAGMTFSLALA